MSVTTYLMEGFKIDLKTLLGLDMHNQWQIQGVAMVSAETPSERAHSLNSDDWYHEEQKLP